MRFKSADEAIKYYFPRFYEYEYKKTPEEIIEYKEKKEREEVIDRMLKPFRDALRKMRTR